MALIDTYEVFRIDPWLRHELVPSLGEEVRFVIAGRGDAFDAGHEDLGVSPRSIRYRLPAGR